MLKPSHFTPTKWLFRTDGLFQLFHGLTHIINAYFSIFIPSCHNRWSMHRSQPVNSTTMWNDFIPQSRLPKMGICFIRVNITVFINLVLLLGFDHVGPLHHIKFIFWLFLRFALGACHHVHSHWVFVLFVSQFFTFSIYNRLAWV